jgi:RNA polymerase sigma-70 factor (ECF subfamily)
MKTRPSLVASHQCERSIDLGRVNSGISAILDAGIQAHLGTQLRVWYGDPCGDKIPYSLARLLDHLTQVIQAHTEPLDPSFIDEVLACLTPLRGFAISLTRDVNQAEDLVQETVLRAISKRAQFETGTSVQAWLFTILRNQFFSAHRRAMREEEDVDGSYAASMICIADQEDKIMIQDVADALGKLPPAQREAILLVGAEGLSYEEAAQALGCAIGTVKSRVSRARSGLATLLGLEQQEGTPANTEIDISDRCPWAGKDVVAERPVEVARERPVSRSARKVRWADHPDR